MTLNQYHIELLTTVNSGDLQRVTKLLSSSKKYSDNINKTDTNGCSVIFYSAWMGRDDICQELINFGADISKQVKTFRPIHVAASKNHVNVVKLFIQNGDTFTIKDIKKIEKSKKQKTKLIPEIIQLSSNNNNNNSIASNNNTMNINHTTIAQKTDSNSETQSQKQSETWISNDKPITVKQTTEEAQQQHSTVSEGQVNADFNNKEVLLNEFMIAVTQGNIDELEKYISNNLVHVNDMIVNDKENEFYNMTPLHVASKFHQHETVVYLVKKGGRYMDPTQCKARQNINNKQQQKEQQQQQQHVQQQEQQILQTKLPNIQQHVRQDHNKTNGTNDPSPGLASKIAETAAAPTAKEKNELLFSDLDRHIKSICDKCEKMEQIKWPKMNKNEELNMNISKSQFNRYVDQLHNQVDCSLTQIMMQCDA